MSRPQKQIHQQHHRRHRDCGLQAQWRHLSLLASGNKTSRGASLAVMPVQRISSNKLVLGLCLAIVLAVSMSLAYPSGAPEQACKDLRPGHGAEPETGVAPFELTQDKSQAGPGEQIKVTLSSPSGVNFKGLIVQANNEAGEAKGKFLPGTGLKTLDSCSAVTHSDKEAKKTATLVWQAPDDLKSKEAFLFKATVVKKFDQIYMNIKSTTKSK